MHSPTPLDYYMIYYNYIPIYISIYFICCFYLPTNLPIYLSASVCVCAHACTRACMCTFVCDEVFMKCLIKCFTRDMNIQTSHSYQSKHTVHCKRMSVFLFTHISDKLLWAGMDSCHWWGDKPNVCWDSHGNLELW